MTRTEFIAKVEPLNARFSLDAVADVPEAISHWIFGPCDGLDTLSTFAIIDACRMPFLRDRLPQTALDWRCLFKGEAETELADVAPYIVRLQPGNRFTRALFADKGRDTDPWPSQAAMFLRSGADIDTLVKHFRKFLRLYSDERKSWFFFRFYAPETLRTMISSMDDDKLAQFCGPVVTMMGQTHDGGMMRLHRPRVEAALET